MSALLAHQGGWDELLFVLAPLALLGFLLVLARRRLDRAAEQDDDTRPGGSRSSPGDG